MEPHDHGNEAILSSASTRTGISAPESSKRARKREQDRLFQRRNRLKTKARISELEKMVAIVKQENTAEKTSAILQELAQVKEQKDALANTLESIVQITQSQRVKLILSPQSKENKTNESPRAKSVNQHQPNTKIIIMAHDESEYDSSSVCYNWSIMDGQVHDTPLSVLSEQQNSSQSPYLPPSGGTVLDNSNSSSSFKDLNAWQVAESLPDNFISNCPCSKNLGDLLCQNNIWRNVNHLVGLMRQKNATHFISKSGPTEDVAVRAVVAGWNEVQRRGQLDSLWEIIRQLDCLLFKAYGKVERLAALRGFRSILEYEIDPSPFRMVKVPYWYRDRQPQTLNHSHAIDFVPWQRVWVRFMFSEHNYCSNRFWRLFAKGLHLDWSFEFRDCYMKNTTTGLYQFSSAFDQAIADLTNWKMSAEFLAEYPELEGEVSKWECKTSGSFVSPCCFPLEMDGKSPITTQTNIDWINTDLTYDSNLLDVCYNRDLVV
ncbi:hypothetical protein F5884DRAFT_401858 [Xylogone sp. PMI_703]|nr:hypothetical protein F5884DRAFT_401858 [Xylogone sp. PMI_703]